MSLLVQKLSLWEILVPTLMNDRPIKTRFHRVWDKKVIELTKGMTILHPVNGRWISPEGTLFAERMIPVRIMCTDEQMAKIVDFTAKYYKQQAIFYYRVSSEVIIKHFDQHDRPKKVS